MYMNIIQTGNIFNIFDSALTIHNTIPAGSYTVQQNPTSKELYLESTEPLAPVTERVYGNQEAKLRKVAKAYSIMNRSLGILLSGPAGTGKTIFLRQVVEKFSELPVVIVSKYIEGVGGFP